MNEGQNGRQHVQARERLQMCEAQESAARAEARERVRAAQERERQERQQRVAASRRRSEDRTMALRHGPAPGTTVQGAAAAEQIDTMAKEPTMGVQDMIE